MPSTSIISAFVEAAKTLGFAFVPEHCVRLQNGRILQTLGHVRDFGSTKGMLLFSESEEPSAEDRSALHQLGYVESILFGSYEQYGESHFKATLNDWQFFGSPSECPVWYTGEGWS